MEDPCTSLCVGFVSEYQALAQRKVPSIHPVHEGATEGFVEQTLQP